MEDGEIVPARPQGQVLGKAGKVSQRPIVKMRHGPQQDLSLPLLHSCSGGGASLCHIDHLPVVVTDDRRDALLLKEVADLARERAIPRHIACRDHLPGPASFRIGNSRLKGRQVAMDIG